MTRFSPPNANGWATLVKRVVLAILLHQQITFDRDLSDALGTGFGLLLLTVGTFIPPWRKARFNGNEQYGRLAGSLIVALPPLPYTKQAPELHTSDFLLMLPAAL